MTNQDTCYCVCHTPYSSCAYCEHYKGDNEVGRANQDTTDGDYIEESGSFNPEIDIEIDKQFATTHSNKTAPNSFYQDTKSIDDELIQLLFGYEGIVAEDGSNIMSVIRQSQLRKLEKAKQIISDQVAKARIAELERTAKYAGAWFRGDERLVNWVNMEVINDRLAQLRSTQ